MIQQLTPGVRVELGDFLRQTAQGVDELLRCSLGGDHAKEKADISGKNDISYDEVAREWAEVCKELLSF